MDTTLPNRNVNLANTPPLNLTNTSSFNSPNPTAGAGADQFNTAIMGLLKQYQGLGTKPFVDQGLNAQQEQANRIMATPPANLAGAAPTLQNSVRTNSAQAVQPIVQSANNSAQTFGEQLNSFGNAVQSAQSFMQNYQQNQQQLKSNAINTINAVISQGGSQGLQSLIDSQPDIFKVAGLDSNTYLNGVLPHLTAQEKAAQDKAAQATQFSLSPGQTQFDSSGKQIASVAPNASSAAPKIIGSASTGYYQVNSDGTTSPITTGGVQNSSAFPTVALQPGQSGAQVSQLQTALGIPVTGTYDAATTAAVLSLQQKLGIDYSSGPGYFGPKTMVAVQGQKVGGSTSTGGAKTVTSGALKYTTADISTGQQKLEGARGSDGYTDPSIYQAMYNAWISGGGLLQDFLTKFPAKNYINPANTWLPAFLMPGGKSGSGRSA